MEIKEWRWSGERAQWTEGRGAASAPADAVLRPDGREYQQMLGFGGCFNELGWRALSRLGEEERDAVLSELFGPGGCRFGLCRLPIGANDYSFDWYSLDEVPGDYELKNFFIERDRLALIPYVLIALSRFIF